MTHIQTVIEQDGQRYVLQRDQLTVLDEFTNVEGDKFVISDFNGAVHQYRVTNAPMQYVEPVLERDLRESGDIDEVGKILMHSKRKRDAMTTMSYFTPVVASSFYRYEENAEADEDHQLLFSFGTLMYKALKRANSKKPIAILFEHGRHIDVLVGTRQRVYAATQVSAYDGSVEAKTGVLSTIQNQLKDIELEEKIKINQLIFYHGFVTDPLMVNWIKALALSDYMGIPLQMAKSASYQLNTAQATQTLIASFFPLLSQLRSTDAVNQKSTTVKYVAHKVAPWFVVGLMALSSVVYAHVVSVKQETDRLTRRIEKLKTDIGSKGVRAKKLRAGYEKTLAEVETLIRASQLPLVADIMLDLSNASQDKILFEAIDISYPDGQLQLKLVGRGRAGGFAVGVPSYNRFIAMMDKYHYSMEDSELLTDTESLSFKLTLKKTL